MRASRLKRSRNPAASASSGAMILTPPAAEVQVVRPVDDAHAAAPDPRLDAVAGDDAAQERVR